VNAGKLRRRIGTRHQHAERAGDRLGGARRRQRADLLDDGWPRSTGGLTEQLRQHLLRDRRRTLSPDELDHPLAALDALGVSAVAFVSARISPRT
jgi:hypothetical protein